MYLQPTFTLNGVIFSVLQQKIMALTCQNSSETDNLPCKASKTGDLPLHIAASQGNVHVVKSLLEKTPYWEHQIKSKNNAGKTPLHVAAENGEKE